MKIVVKLCDYIGPVPDFGIFVDLTFGFRFVWHGFISKNNFFFGHLFFPPIERLECNVITLLWSNLAGGYF